MDDDILEVGLPEVFICGECQETLTNRVLVFLEPVFSERGEILGIDAVSEAPLCGHRMYRVQFDPAQVAVALDSGVPMLFGQMTDDDEP